MKLLFEDILYLEASGNYVTFVLKDKTILSRSTFLEATNLLPADKFLRDAPFFYRSLNKIDKLEGSPVTINNARLPVSEAYIQQLSSAVNK